MKRVILIVLDSVGIGSAPDAHLYGDAGSNTLGHIADNIKDFNIPNLVALGLGNIDPNNKIAKTEAPLASYGKAEEKSVGKDTTTGHWEIAGNILAKPFPVFLDGFPASFINEFENAINRKTIGNFAASGTQVIMDLGDEHVRTGCPIVYTSADSVFQIAMHEDIIPIEEQYKICKIARDLLVGDMEVGRVIARPFIGKSGTYSRTSRRKDFATMPGNNVMTAIINSGGKVTGIGKIYDIFAGKNISTSIKTVNNAEGIKATIDCIKSGNEQLIFTNLVDFDMMYGHRRDVAGYAQCIEEFDAFIPEILGSMAEDDLLIITADHGNDPTWTGTDHTREYIPLLVYSSHLNPVNLRVRSSFADIGATIADVLSISKLYVGDGESFL